MYEKYWEYRIYNTANGVNPDSEYELDYLGQMGWELVSICDDTDGTKKFYFKRETTKKKYSDYE